MHQSFVINNPLIIKEKVLNWLKQFNTFCFLDSNGYQPFQYEIIAAAGTKRRFESNSNMPLELLQEFIDKKPVWLFGHLSYETTTADHLSKNKHPDFLKFPVVYFFEPEILVHINESVLHIDAADPVDVFEQISKTNVVEDVHGQEKKPEIQGRITHDEYIGIIQKLKQHIRRGDCYEINFCQEFFSANIKADAVNLYHRLNKISPNPFSALYRLGDKWLICASPERFLKKAGNKIFSQPIKGTLSKMTGDDKSLHDEQEKLLNSDKDRAENVMVVDLVRNDLSRICVEGSVKVDELYGIYSFPQVHQMISTISGKLSNDISFSDILNATFPMGSMTGAPKIRVMELIDRYEKSKRGIFSGTVGYITPAGDFDLNVVIRSIMYNATEKYLSFQAGSGITIYSDAEKEWEECMVKIAAIRKILESGD